MKVNQNRVIEWIKIVGVWRELPPASPSSSHNRYHIPLSLASYTLKAWPYSSINLITAPQINITLSWDVGGVFIIDIEEQRIAWN